MPNRRIELFKTGKHTSSSGASFDFSPDVVKLIATTFSPSKAPAPVVVGHPEMDAPAYGWVTGLDFDEASGTLFANIDVCDELDQAITAKHYTRTSAAFFSPDGPSNPTAGQFYLRHVGMLGGAAPAVVGLKPFGFADKAKPGAVVTLETALPETKTDNPVVALMSQLARAFGIAAGQSGGTVVTFDPHYAAPAATGATTMNEQEKAEFERVKAENAALKTAAGDAAKNAVLSTAKTFAAELVTAKKINPADVDETVAMYCAMAALPQIEFASNGTTTKKSPLDTYVATMKSRADVIDTKAKTPATERRSESSAAEPKNFSAASGVQFDEESTDLHNRVVAYQAKNGGASKISYAAALDAVNAGSEA